GDERQVLKPVTVQLGFSDGSFTEVVSGLEENAVVAVGVVAQATAAAPVPGGSPFGGPPFGGGPRIR
ncbi:MAG TPA: efflux RND transporter periplasmic adaptor subunit, partial [Methylomirabilota bacterium]|nr:efflux RND transporter periplasmic adaptor subunit [Methylomirabilota bacterium]